jgi:hypothetical protein
MIALGIIGLVQGDFTPTWAGVPKDFPAREAWPISAGPLLTGIGLFWRRSAVASRVLLIVLLLWLLLFRLSRVFIDPRG